MSDIVERLKARLKGVYSVSDVIDLMGLAEESADEITRLQARVAELEGVISLCEAHFNSSWWGENGEKNKRISERGCRRKIAKALKGGA